MGNLFKTFGKGILYVIGFPFFILALVIFGIVGLFLFIFHLFKSIFYFFSGRKFFPELPEDKQLRLMREAQNAAANPEPQPVEDIAPQAQPVAPQFVEERPIFVEEPAAQNVEPAYQEPQQQAPIFEEEPAYQEPVQPQQVEPQPVQPEPQPAAPQKESPKSTIPFHKYNRPEDPYQNTIDTSSNVDEDGEEVLEEYVPAGSSFSDSLDDDEDTNNGVDINYDV